MAALHSSDMRLARRIEAIEASNGLKAAQSMQARGDSQGAAEPHLGGYAVFGGVNSPMTHALGIGMQGPVTGQEFDAMERFFFDRGSASLIDLCPMAHESVQEMVKSRGYRIIEFNNVMVRTLDGDMPEPVPDLEIRTSGDEEAGMWGRLIMEGFSEGREVTDEQAAAVTGACFNYHRLTAGIGGERVGGGATNYHEGAAAFCGDATLPQFRERGVQSALIVHRLREARDAGCDLAMACVIPGSGSHRNYERLGFRLMYMRVNVMRER